MRVYLIKLKCDFSRWLHQVPVHVLGGRFLELRDSDEEEDGEEADVESDIDDCSVCVHSHWLWQPLQVWNYATLETIDNIRSNSRSSELFQFLTNVNIPKETKTHSGKQQCYLTNNLTPFSPPPPFLVSGIGKIFPRRLFRFDNVQTLLAWIFVNTLVFINKYLRNFSSTFNLSSYLWWRVIRFDKCCWWSCVKILQGWEDRQPT